MTDSKIRDILLSEDYISDEDIKKAEEFAASHHTSIVDYLLAENLLTKDLFGQAIAESYGVDYADLNSFQPSRDQVLKIPENLAKKYNAVLFNENDSEVVVATDDPEADGLRVDLNEVFGRQNIKLAYSLSEDIASAFIHYRKALETRFVKIISEDRKVAPELIREILEDAILFHASDIHFEPQGKEVLIRFRIDGVLHDAGRLPIQHYELILNRIKVQSHLRIDEHFSAQDGAMRHTRPGGTVDLRVSIVPTLEGEKVVIRVLSEYVRSFTLMDLGLSYSQHDFILASARKPFGMVLVTGPTGSGKTTTLYSLVKMINRPELNITTIEDPVEYKLAGINQIQVNPRTNLTFAQGLRSIIRQDPNIILVGEIRDRETVEIALNAALTGHLLFSTFHANDAPTAIPRLLDMSAEPFLLASTLNLIIAQRLLRKVCDSCRYSFPAPVSWLEDKSLGLSRYFSAKSATLYQGKGCNACNMTGYRGRVGIFEFIRVTPEMQDLILRHPSSNQLWSLARSQGSLSLFEDGLDKVKAGITSLEELMRVASPPQNI